MKTTLTDISIILIGYIIESEYKNEFMIIIWVPIGSMIVARPKPTIMTSRQAINKIFPCLYVRVFECKCFILNKKPKTSKFAPKVDEGFLLGYGSNEHVYHVFNKTFGRVEIAIDVTFYESNGSQMEQVDSNVVGKEDPPCEAIKQLVIGDIRP